MSESFSLFRKSFSNVPFHFLKLISVSHYFLNRGHGTARIHVPDHQNQLCMPASRHETRARVEYPVAAHNWDVLTPHPTLFCPPSSTRDVWTKTTHGVPRCSGKRAAQDSPAQRDPMVRRSVCRCFCARTRPNRVINSRKVRLVLYACDTHRVCSRCARRAVRCTRMINLCCVSATLWSGTFSGARHTKSPKRRGNICWIATHVVWQKAAAAWTSETTVRT